MSRISQREARRLRKRVKALEYERDSQRRRWGAEYVGGVEIGRVKWETNDAIPVAVRTARSLKHAVVVTDCNDGIVRFIALPLGREE